MIFNVFYKFTTLVPRITLRFFQQLRKTFTLDPKKIQILAMWSLARSEVRERENVAVFQ
jgi:hypothetical protein